VRWKDIVDSRMYKKMELAKKEKNVKPLPQIPTMIYENNKSTSKNLRVYFP
jgi:hypothetical protein